MIEIDCEMIYSDLEGHYSVLCSKVLDTDIMYCNALIPRAVTMYILKTSKAC